MVGSHSHGGFDVNMHGMDVGSTGSGNCMSAEDVASLSLNEP